MVAETVETLCGVALLDRALIDHRPFVLRTERLYSGCCKLVMGRFYNSCGHLNTGVRMIQPNATWETPEEEQEEEDEDLEEERKITEEKEDEEDEDDEDDEEV